MLERRLRVHHERAAQKGRSGGHRIHSFWRSLLDRHPGISRETTRKFWIAADFPVWEQLDLENAVLWIPDSKTPNGEADVPLTPLAIEAFRDQLRLSPLSPYLFPSDGNPSGHQKSVKKVWRLTLKRAKIPYFRIYDLRSTYVTRLSAGGVADEWVTQMLRQGDAKVFKKYSQTQLQMKREALIKLNRQANEAHMSYGTARVN